MTSKPETVATANPLFGGDVQVQGDVRVDRKGGAPRAIIKKVLMDKLALEGDFLAAATVEVSPGKSVLLLGAADVLGHLDVHRHECGFEVVSEEGEDVRVDAVTAAFLALKQAQFESGDLDLSGPYSADEVEALNAEAFEEAERLLQK